MMISIAGIVVILTLTGFMFNQYRIYQADQLIIDQCFENFDTKGKVVMKKENFWSPITCENS
ncbi:hypothetical protein [Chungangia koreensis]